MEKHETTRRGRRSLFRKIKKNTALLMAVVLCLTSVGIWSFAGEKNGYLSLTDDNVLSIRLEQEGEEASEYDLVFDDAGNLNLPGISGWEENADGYAFTLEEGDAVNESFALEQMEETEETVTVFLQKDGEEIDSVAAEFDAPEQEEDAEVPEDAAEIAGEDAEDIPESTTEAVAEEGEKEKQKTKEIAGEDSDGEIMMLSGDDGIKALASDYDVTEISAGSVISVPAGTEGVYYSFTPEVTGTYDIGSWDEYAYFNIYTYDSKTNTPTEEADCAKFYRCFLNKEETYYLKITNETQYDDMFWVTSCIPIELNEIRQNKVYEELEVAFGYYCYTPSESGYYRFSSDAPNNWNATEVDVLRVNITDGIKIVNYSYAAATPNSVSTWLDVGETYYFFYWSTENFNVKLKYLGAELVTTDMDFTKIADKDSASSGETIRFTETAKPLIGDDYSNFYDVDSTPSLYIKPFADVTDSNKEDREENTVSEEKNHLQTYGGTWGDSDDMVVFHDTMDKELILDENSIGVTYHRYDKNGNVNEFILDNENNLEDNELFRLDTSPDDGCTFHVTVNLDAVASTPTDETYEDQYIDSVEEFCCGSYFELTYDATLSENATPGAYQNTAYGEFGIYYDTKSSTVTSLLPSNYNYYATSPEETVTIDTYGVMLYKVEGYQMVEVSINPLKTDDPLAGAEFTLWDADDNVLETIVTGEDGYGYSSRTYADGTYLKVQETKAPEGYLIGNYVYRAFNVNGNDATDYWYDLGTYYNSPQYAEAWVSKTIENSDEEFTAAGLDPDEEYCFTIVFENRETGETYEVEISNWGGWYVDLPAGTYIITEKEDENFELVRMEPATPVLESIPKPESYNLTSFSVVPDTGNTVDFDLYETDDDGNPLSYVLTFTGDDSGDPYYFNLNVYNQIKTQTYGFGINKVDENGDPLNGATFEIYDATNRCWPYFMPQDDGETYVLCDNAEDGATCEISAGYARIEGLSEGSYECFETTAPTGYVTRNTFTVEVSENGVSLTGADEGVTVSDDGVVTYPNYVQSGYITVEKYFSNSEEEIAKALDRAGIDTDSFWNDYYFTVVFENTETGETYEAKISGNMADLITLPAGTYIVTEKEDDIFKLTEMYTYIIGGGTYLSAIDNNYGADFSVYETDENGNPTSYILTMEKNDNGYDYNFNVCVVNELKTITYDVEIQKTDTDGNSLNGAEVYIKDGSGEILYFDGNGNLCDKDDSGASQTVTIGKTTLSLPEDTYSLYELTAPDGYVKLTSPVVFTVTEDGIALESGAGSVSTDGWTLSVKNTATVLMPNAGSSNLMRPLLIGFGIIGGMVAAGGVIRFRRRKLLLPH